MKSINFAVDIELSPKQLRLGMLGILMCLTATDLASENVTLATYYPSPSGVYTNMITTGDTWLARDSGIVEIGANAVGPTTCVTQPACGTRLAIMNGNVGLSTGTAGAKLSFNDLNDGTNGADGITWYNPAPTAYGIFRTLGAWSAPNYQQLKLAWDTGLVFEGGTLYGKSGTVLQPTGGKVGIGTGVVAPRALLEVNGEAKSALTTCGSVNYVFGTDLSCPGGTYATWNQGFMSKYQTMPLAAGGSMYCCPCPTGTCPAL
jgi:hypothetical protein